MDLRAAVLRALRVRDAGLDEAAWERLERLDALLASWNRRVDLHGFRSARERACRYFAEPLAARERFQDAEVAVEVGAGGGSPGLPLAIAMPSIRWVLVESNGRKALFLDEATRALELRNVEVVEGRYEAWGAPEGLDLAVLRGVAAPPLSEKLARDLGGGGRLLWFTSSRAGSQGVPGFRALGAVTGPLVRGGATLWEGVPADHVDDVSRETSG